MTSDQKTEILRIVSAWLDSASNPESSDRELLLRKHGLVKDQNKRTVGVSFIIEARTSVGQVMLPVDSSPIVTPTTDDVARIKSHE